MPVLGNYMLELFYLPLFLLVSFSLFYLQGCPEILLVCIPLLVSFPIPSGLLLSPNLPLGRIPSLHTYSKSCIHLFPPCLPHPAVFLLLPRIWNLLLWGSQDPVRPLISGFPGL